MSALNQSSEGCDWNKVHIRSSFHEVRKSSTCEFASGKFRGAVLVSIDRSVASGIVRLALLVCIWTDSMSGLQRPINVVQRRCSRLTNLFSDTSSEMLSVTSWRSWKSCAFDVPTTLQNTTKKGHSGYESMVLATLAKLRVLRLFVVLTRKDTGRNLR